MKPMTAKRSYTRRTDEQRIAELQAKIEELKVKAREVSRPDLEVLRHAPKLHAKLRAFAQVANDHGRADVANSTLAFLAGLDRMLATLPEPTRRGQRASDESPSKYA
ncbi:MAG: hypothetical protein IT454_19275 [Planctomycetes bacterium]|nr:hypothetical protein [Planctomycetota bacterium]